MFFSNLAQLTRTFKLEREYIKVLSHIRSSKALPRAQSLRTLIDLHMASYRQGREKWPCGVNYGFHASGNALRNRRGPSVS